MNENKDTLKPMTGKHTLPHLGSGPDGQLTKRGPLQGVSTPGIDNTFPYQPSANGSGTKGPRWKGPKSKAS